jgi:DUF4097 and DUF4098 domain-containing protein YvlB
MSRCDGFTRGGFFLGVGMACFAAQAFAASETREVTRSFTVEREVRLENLAGKVSIGRSKDRQVTVAAVVHATAEDAAKAKALLDLLRVEFQAESGVLDVRAHYPLDRHQVYRYPPIDPNGNSTSQSTYDGHRIKVTTKNEPDAVELYVDFTLSLPAGVAVTVDQYAGTFAVSGIEGDVHLENGWGDVSVTDSRGSLVTDTGSGKVRVTGQRGEVEVGTGSGAIELDNVTGQVDLSTGSGDVVASRVDGNVSIDTGSGDVEVREITGAIDIDTGSGDALIAGAKSQRLDVGTGSGTIRVESPAIFRSKPGADATFETGSGDIVLLIDPDVSMLLDFESGSGKVKSPRSLEGRIERVGPEGSRRYRIGEGASRVRAETGAGDVVLELADR